MQGGEPDIGTVAKMILNDFQRGKLPYFVRPPGCDEDATRDSEFPPVQEPVIPGISEEGQEGKEGNEEGNEGEEGKEGEEDMTDVESTCSGLSDVSGLSDLDFDLPSEDEVKQQKGKNKKNKEHEVEELKTTRGKRGGQKHKPKPKKEKITLEVFIPSSVSFFLLIK